MKAVYAVVVCSTKDGYEDVLMIYRKRNDAEEHVVEYQEMYNAIGCYLKVSEFELQ